MKIHGCLPIVLFSMLALAGCAGSVARSEPSEIERIDLGLAAAGDYLLGQQSADGAWRSGVYAPFQGGDALTPLVLTALVELPRTAARDRAIERATRYLCDMVRADGTIEPFGSGLAYAVYTAAGAVLALAEREDGEARRARDAWLDFLRRLQLSEELGWGQDDPGYGGWGYASGPTAKPAAGQAMSPLAEPNLSATVFALRALRAAGSGSDDPAVQRALAFVRRCQNFANGPDVGEPFDDGGFFFIACDPVRNKAGVVGVDRLGRTRYASYGSATADGLLALELCGLSVDDAEVAAARRWLAAHYQPGRHPGGYEQKREGARQAVYFYYCQSLAAALEACPPCATPEGLSHHVLAEELLARQRVDGSWQNGAVDVREDDPLVATALAARALASCRRAMAVAGGTLLAAD